MVLLCTAACARARLPGEIIEPDPEPPIESEPDPPAWTLLLYVNADNDLESAAIADLNELESSEWAQAQVFALVDRAPGYDTSNEDWTGARLYRIELDTKPDQTIRSHTIELPALGMSPEAELNLGEPAVLGTVIDHLRSLSPTEKFALVLWGHGSGWRAGREPAPVVGRAFGYDESDDDTLFLHELGSALSGRSVDLLAMDLCYGAMLEVAAELAGDVSLLVASEGIVPESGWDYASFLELAAVENAGDPTPAKFAELAVQAGSESWASVAGATISAIDLAAIGPVLDAHNSLSDALYDLGEASEVRTAITAVLFNDVEDYYATPGDLNVDLGDLAAVVAAEFPEVAGPAAELDAALSTAVIAEWHHGQGNPRSTGVAVHYVSLDSGGLPIGHDQSYFQGYPTPTPLAFVQSSTWVPVYDNGPGLLYRLWYEGAAE